jgi:hypothetical protein
MSNKAVLVTVPEADDVYLIIANESNVIVRQGIAGKERQFIPSTSVSYSYSEYPEFVLLEVDGTWNFDLIDDLIAAFDCSEYDRSFGLLKTNEERIAAQPSAHA